MELHKMFSIDPVVQEIFPGIKVGLVVIHDVKVTKSSTDLYTFQQQSLLEIQKTLQGRDISEIPHIRELRAIYKKFGVDPNSRRSSIEALLRRVVDPTKTLYCINTVVDSSNIASLQLQLPVGMYDLHTVALPVTLRFAKEGEVFQPLGEQQEKKLSAGELVYADCHRILCRDFNYRDAEFTKVTTITTEVLAFVDGYEGIERYDLLEATERLAQLVVKFNGGSYESPTVFPF